MGIFSEIPFIEKLRSDPAITERIYLVGGAIRDHLMGKPVADVDLTCESGIKTGRKIADKFGFGFFVLDVDHDTCRLIETLPDGERRHYDISGFRGAIIEEDLRGRDVTINAIAIEIKTEEVLDPTGGVKHLREKRLVPCSSTAIADDPARILRVVRFANSLGFRVDKELFEQITENKNKLANVSCERARDELVKIFSSRNSHIGIQVMEKMGVLALVLPGLQQLKGVQQSRPHVQDVYAHTVSTVRHLSTIINLTSQPYEEEAANADLMNGLLVLKLGRYREKLIAYYGEKLVEDRSRVSLLKIAGALHDIGKPEVMSIEEGGRIRFVGHAEVGAGKVNDTLTKYKFSNQEIDMITAVTRHHMRFHSLVSRKDSGLEIKDRYIYRFFDRSEGVGVDAVLLGLADTRATYEHTLTQDTWRTALDVAEILLDGYFERYDTVIKPDRLLNGSELMAEMELGPGPLLGKLLSLLQEEQAAGNLAERADAVNFAREKLEELNGQ